MYLRAENKKQSLKSRCHFELNLQKDWLQHIWVLAHTDTKESFVNIHCDNKCQVWMKEGITIDWICSCDSRNLNNLTKLLWFTLLSINAIPERTRCSLPVMSITLTLASSLVTSGSCLFVGPVVNSSSAVLYTYFGFFSFSPCTSKLLNYDKPQQSQQLVMEMLNNKNIPTVFKCF